MTVRNVLRKANWIAEAQFGLNIRRMARSIAGFFRFIADWLQFRKQYTGRLEWLPCLHDWYEEGGVARGEYFWQDLYVARKIYVANPSKHVDIGSRIDGFVAHIASFREIEVFDIRSITANVPGMIFKKVDLMSSAGLPTEYCDSLSCLHALEHFGLGRYGDPIDALGHEAGLRNMSRILKSSGKFYLSVPVGIERVEFNGHRVFDPNTIVRLAAENGLVLESFASVGPTGELAQAMSPENDFKILSGERYALGIFVFVKK